MLRFILLVFVLEFGIHLSYVLYVFCGVKLRIFISVKYLGISVTNNTKRYYIRSCEFVIFARLELNYIYAQKLLRFAKLAFSTSLFPLHVNRTRFESLGVSSFLIHPLQCMFPFQKRSHYSICVVNIQ